VQWPAEAEPSKCPVHARNEIAIAAPPERVWRWLIRAARWPNWYSNCANVEILSDGGPDLAAGTEFRWKTFGAAITSRVLVFDPPHEILWNARGVLTAYHGWTIAPEGAGSRVVTEETQRGFLPRIGWWYLRPMLERGHQNWIESLKRMAEGGEPD
jgi:uncharacterized protein YndB with AHSA1/START domain